MALSLLWDTAFEARPPAGLNRNQLDNELRLFRNTTKQVMSREHNFGGAIDDGRHAGGRVTTHGVGGVAERDALTNVPDGALWVLAPGDDTYSLQGYRSATASWITIGALNHSALSGLTATGAHPEFLLKSGGTLSRPVNALNAGIHVPGAASVFSGYTTSEHFVEGHPNQVRDTIEAAASGSLPLAKLKKRTITSVASVTRTTVAPPDFYFHEYYLPTASTATVTGDSLPSAQPLLVAITGVTVTGQLTCLKDRANEYSVNACTPLSFISTPDVVNTSYSAYLSVGIIQLGLATGQSTRLYLTYAARVPYEINVTVSVTADVYGGP